LIRIILLVVEHFLCLRIKEGFSGTRFSRISSYCEDDWI
jgi:hypothetical protein